ncbi:MAG: hypothetical protein ACE5D3_07560, partial [Candidatus Binatia bacterium]
MMLAPILKVKSVHDLIQQGLTSINVDGDSQGQQLHRRRQPAAELHEILLGSNDGRIGRRRGCNFPDIMLSVGVVVG